MSLALVLVALALAIIAVLAVQSLSRVTSSRDDREITRHRLELVAAALDQYVTTAGRLPCPADPALSGAAETGLGIPNAFKCANGTGVVPWKDLGLRREDAADAWGRRISYRVFTGDGAGVSSLTRPRGASMVDCDLWRIYPSSLDPEGLCATGRTTDASDYLGVARLQLDELDRPTRSDVAFVLISHGATGFGGHTIAGVQMPAPKGAELNNTTAAGPFAIKVFSNDPAMKTDDNDHFDDIVVYRTIADLIKRSGLVARNYTDPETGTPLPGATRFTLDTVRNRPGVAMNTGNTSTGAVVIDFSDFTSVGGRGGSVAVQSFSETAGGGALGVGGTNPRVSFAEGEWMLLFFETPNLRRLGITLSAFASFDGAAARMTENVTFYFYRGGTLVATLPRASCHSLDIASFDLQPGFIYDAVFIFPTASTGTSASGPVTGDTDFMLSEIRTCADADATCRTSISTLENSCP
jgi:type II secretory pathway pseudopilin PulG